MTDQQQTPDQPDDGEARNAKTFTSFLIEQRNGGLHQELTEGLQHLVAAVGEYDKAGSLTLTVNVKPAGNGMNVVISDEVKVKAPEAPRPIALWFFDDEGNVSRADPRQPELPIREVNTPAKQVREVGA